MLTPSPVINKHSFIIKREKIIVNPIAKVNRGMRSTAKNAGRDCAAQAFGYMMTAARDAPLSSYSAPQIKGRAFHWVEDPARPEIGGITNAVSPGKK